MHETDVIIDVHLVLGIGKRQRTIRLLCIRPFRRQREKFRLVSCGKAQRLQRFQTGGIVRFIRLVHEECEFLFFFHADVSLLAAAAANRNALKEVLPDAAPSFFQRLLEP